ncbi:hypothetical protein MHK_009903, partial [Candidatus Magnetomorum sp. HK-1]
QHLFLYKLKTCETNKEENRDLKERFSSERKSTDFVNKKMW